MLVIFVGVVLLAEGVIRGIWQEELERSENILKLNERMIQELPKGSLHVKKIKGNEYHYLFYREARRVKSIYIGNNPDKIAILRKQIERRKILVHSIKRLKSDIKLLKKAVKLK